MRAKHELDRGIVCEKCSKTVYKGEYVRINTFSQKNINCPDRFYSIDRVNLCHNCYELYTTNMKNFMS